MTSPTLKNKVSPHIQDQLPGFIKSDHPLFATFLKYYYEFLEAGELGVSGSNDYVVEETITKNFITSEDDTKLVLESSIGKFIAGEIITGSTSKATATILVDDFDANNRLFITSQQRFETGETVTGATSGATTTVVSYRANPVQNIQQLLAYADVDNTVYSFLDKFRDSLMESIPNTLAEGTEKRKLIKSIKDLYAAKGTADAHKLFFRILFNEEPDIIYPRDNILRASDGEWSTDKVIRITETGTSDFTTAVGEFVTGSTSGAKAILNTVIKFREGNAEIAELSLDENSIVGTFVQGEVILSTDTAQDLEIGGVVKGIVTGLSIDKRGSYYDINDTVTIGTGGNDAATARVESIQPGSVDDILIESGGSGYAVGDNLVFNLTGTEGASLVAKVSVVGGGITLEPDTSPDQIVTEDNFNLITIHNDNFEMEDATLDDAYLVMETGDSLVLEQSGLVLTEKSSLEYALEEGTTQDLTGDIIMEDGNQLLREEADIFFGSLEQTVGELDHLVFEDNTQIILEPQTFIDLGVSSQVGEITKVEIITGGDGFLKTPTTTVSSTAGTGAELYALSKQLPRIGSIGDVSITNFGLDYVSQPIPAFNRNFIIKDYSGTFSVGDTLTSHVGTVVNFDSSRNLLKIKTSVTLDDGDTLTTVTGATATIAQADFASATVNIGTVGTTVGDFQSERGKLSTESMKVQDSYYYQDYSYVVRVGESINRWRDSIRRSVHPAGWNVFGEVSFATQVSATIQVPAAGSIGDFTGDDTFSPELASTFTNLFTTVFGRRLGTTTGTTQRVSATVGVISPSDLSNSTRDVTLTSDVSVRMNIGRGAHLTGPTLENVAHYAFSVHPTTTSVVIPNHRDPSGRTATTASNQSRDQYTLAQIGYVGIREIVNADGTIPASAFTKRINFMPPSEIYISRSGLTNAFDNNFISFDDGIQRFDESGNTRDTEGRYATSFDEVTISFDETTTNFDADSITSGGAFQLFSTLDTTFDNSSETYDTQ